MHACVCVCLGGEGQDIDQSGWGKCFYFFSLPVSTEEEGEGPTLAMKLHQDLGMELVSHLMTPEKH